MISTAILVGAALTLANFFWQLLFDRDWFQAAERSYFQLIAIAIFLLTLGMES